MENNNLNLWEKVQETNPKFTKKVSYGNRSFTTINASYQMKVATKAFGTYGKTWGIESIENEFINLDKGQIMVLGKAVFFYTLDGEKTSFPISASIMLQQYNDKKQSLVIDDEFAKKLETDITTKALSKLGFSADVFMGNYDDNKYLNSLKNKYSKPNPQQQQPTEPEPKQQPIQPEPTPKTEITPTPLKMARKSDIELIVELAQNGDFDRAERGLKYWESDGRGILESQKNEVLKTIKELRQKKSLEVFEGLKPKNKIIEINIQEGKQPTNPEQTQQEPQQEPKQEPKPEPKQEIKPQPGQKPQEQIKRPEVRRLIPDTKPEPKQETKIKSYDDIVQNSSPDLNEIINLFKNE